MISTLSGKIASGGIILTTIPKTPGFKGAVAKPSVTNLVAGSPHFLM